jgi:hypothetical protein
MKAQGEITLMRNLMSGTAIAMLLSGTVVAQEFSTT